MHSDFGTHPIEHISVLAENKVEMKVLQGDHAPSFIEIENSVSQIFVPFFRKYFALNWKYTQFKMIIFLVTRWLFISPVSNKPWSICLSSSVTFEILTNFSNPLHPLNFSCLAFDFLAQQSLVGIIYQVVWRSSESAKYWFLVSLKVDVPPYAVEIANSQAGSSCRMVSRRESSLNEERYEK